MTYNEFLDRIINDGIAAAKADYTKPEDVERLEGSIAGFEACRNLQPQELVDMFVTAGKYVTETFGDKQSKYWYFRCYQLEVEWVINVVSAILMNQGQSPLLAYLPTSRGVMKAAEIVGVH